MTVSFTLSDSDQDENKDSGNEDDSPLSPPASEDVPTTNGTDAPTTNSTCTTTNVANVTQNQNNNTEDSSTASSASPSKTELDNDKCNPQRLKEDNESVEKDNDKKDDNNVGKNQGDGPWQDDGNSMCNGFVDASDGSEEKNDDGKKSDEITSENGSKESSTCCKYLVLINFSMIDNCLICDMEQKYCVIARGLQLRGFLRFLLSRKDFDLCLGKGFDLNKSINYV